MEKFAVKKVRKIHSVENPSSPGNFQLLNIGSAFLHYF